MPFLIPALLFNPHGISVALLSDPTVSWLASPLALVISVDRPQEYVRITSQVPTKDQPTPHSHKLHIDTVCLCRNVLLSLPWVHLLIHASHVLTQLLRCCTALRQAQCRYRKDNLERMLEETWQGRCLHSPSQACPCYWNTHCPIRLAHIVGFIHPVPTRPIGRLLSTVSSSIQLSIGLIDRTRKLLVFPVRLLHRTSIHDPTSITIDAGLANTRG